MVSRRNIRLWLSSDARNVLLCIPPFGASAYVLLTIMVCGEDTIANGPSMGGLSQCVLKGTRTVLREGRGSDAPNLPDLTTYVCS
ncbi:FHA domain-containing protein [Priestia megaterium]